MSPRLSPGEVYGLYCALRAHFTSWSYDFHRYLGKLEGVDQRSFNARSDRWAFEKIAKHKDPFGVLLANIADRPFVWIGEIGEEIYWEHQRHLQALEHHVKQQFPTLDPDFYSNFVCKRPGTHPKLIRLLLGRKISLQTATVLVDLSRCLAYWKQAMVGDVLFEESVRRVAKYLSFIRYDKQLMVRNIKLDIDKKA